MAKETSPNSSPPATAETELSGHNDSMSSTSASDPYSVSELEAKWYYAGLPSSPRLVYRTGSTPWTAPSGLEAFRVLKELRPVFGHKINTVWEEHLANKVIGCLNSVNVEWTSIDIVRFAVVGEAPGPVVLWIGVVPASLSGTDAHAAALGCLALLKEYDITDVDVEFRESVVTRFAKLLDTVPDLGPTADVRGPLTPVLGLQIAAERTPFAGGTGGVYISEGGNSDKILLLTTRHVVFPPDEVGNDNYVHKDPSKPRRKVLLLGTNAFDNFVKTIQARRDSHASMVEEYKDQLELWGKRGITEAMKKAYLSHVDMSFNAIVGLDKFKDVMINWSNTDQRILGHIVRSPPIDFGVGAEQHTEDYALIELDKSKIDMPAFRGNVIDLGTEIPRHQFRTKMYPRSEAGTSFKYPPDRLLQLQGPIQEDDMHNPDMLDHNKEPCLLVIKNGSATGVTIGRATGSFSRVRYYLPDGTTKTSAEWSILPYDHESGVFCKPGDSGSIIVDGRGRIGGLLTGGAGKVGKSDIAFATPFVG